MRWLDKIPLLPLALGAVFLGLAPLIPEPHVWEKLKMLAEGTLSQPLDIFDLVMHASLPVLFIMKVIRLVMIHRSGDLSA